MLNKKPSCQSLAIFVALALESSAFLAPSSPVFAADVTMDSEHTHYMFQGARTITTDGTTAWGGHSTEGSTTTDNIVTLDDSVAGTYQKVYGGWTEGNTTGDSTKNQLTIAEKANLMDSGVEIYGGYTGAKDGGRANENTVIIQRDVNGFVKGGFSPNQSADENTVRIGKVRVTGNVSGGEGIRTANKNEVHLTGTTVGDSVYGGYSRGKATDNKVYLYGGVNITRNLYGGYGSSDSTGNKLFVEGKDNKAQKVERFQQMTFKTDGVAEGETMLKVTGKNKTTVDWNKLDATGTAQDITLLRNEQGITFSGGYTPDSVKSKLSADGKSEYDIEAVGSGGKVTDITYKRYQFEGKTTLSQSTDSYGTTSTWGGRSLVANTTKKNIVTLDNSVAGVHQYIYGGWSRRVPANVSGAGDSMENELTIAETAVLADSDVQIYGGYTSVGEAAGNIVTIKRDVTGFIKGGRAGHKSAIKNIVRVGKVAITGSVVGGDSPKTADENEVHLTGTTVTGDVYGGSIRSSMGGAAKGNKIYLNGGVTVTGNVIGGRGATTNNNIIHLKNAAVTGTVTGGTAAGGTGNTLKVCYGTKSSEIGDFQGIQNLHFDLENAPSDGTAHTLLNLKNVGGNKSLANTTIEFYRSGDAKKLEKGDSFTLMDNQTAGGGFTIDETTKVKGMNGISYNYEFEIAPDKDNVQKLKATVTKVGMTETAKSPVETRAGLASFVNQGADTLVESGISAAEMAVSADAGAAGGKSGAASKSNDANKNVQRKTAATDNASYQLWAGAGANTMRVESGSHVDSKGWSLGVGWAREDEMKDGAKRLFSPFVEYGRGTYDSYLDNGAHGSGTIRYLGIGVLGKLTQKDGLWLEGSVRGGRATSDYQLHGSSDANYDGSNTYYGIHLGIGKTVELRKDAAIDAYARYFWSHQNGMSVKLSSGDDYDFASVDSHRLRLGFRYSQKDQQQGEFYTGLAWEYEFDGEARASIGGDAAPSPSLKGSSYMLELGYRFMPENSRVSYDLHLNGWQGKRKGISGGVAVKWAF